MDEKVSAAYPLVDQIEGTRVSDDDLETFVREGRLGGTAEASAPVGVGPYARLRLLGATGDTEGVVAFSDEHTPMPPAVSDAEFVKRLGMGFTPEHEYWLGRAVAAAALAEHGLDPNPAYQPRPQGRVVDRVALRPPAHDPRRLALRGARQPGGQRHRGPRRVRS
jgi:hypothetical protein